MAGPNKSLTSATIERINNVSRVTPDDDLQSIINAEQPGTGAYRQRVVLDGYVFNETEINVPRGVTLDARGVTIDPSGGTFAFLVEGDATILMHGSSIRGGLQAPIFLFDASVGESPGTSHPAMVRGFPKVVESGDPVVKVINNNGSGVSNIFTEVNGQNAGQLIDYDMTSGGFINNNYHAFTGSTNAGSKTVIDMGVATTGASGNIVHAPAACQIKDGDEFAYFLRNSGSIITGSFADIGLVSSTAINFSNGSNCGVHLVPQYHPSPADSSGGNGCVVSPLGQSGMHAQNLSGNTGQYNGQILLDDGTNTTGSGILCVWTGSAWQPMDGSATFT